MESNLLYNESERLETQIQCLLETPTFINNIESNNEYLDSSNKDRVSSFKCQLRKNPLIDSDILRMFYGLHYSYTNKLIQKISISDDLKVLTTLSDFCYLDNYLIQDKKIVNSLAEKNEIIDFVALKNNQVIVYFTEFGLYSWNYAVNNVNTLLEMNRVQIRAMDVSLDSRYIAGGCCSGNIYIVDSIKAKLKVVFHSHKSKIYALSFTQDGKYLISGGGSFDNLPDYNIRIWNILRKSLMSILAGHALTVYKIRIHESGDFFLSLSRDNTIRLWNLKNIIKESVLTETQGLVIDRKHREYNFSSKMIEKQEKVKFKNTYLGALNILSDKDHNKLDPKYIAEILKTIKEKNEIERGDIESDYYFEAKGRLAPDIFFSKSFIYLFNPRDLLFEKFSINKFKKQKLQCMKINPLTNICFVADKNFAYVDKNQNLKIISIGTKKIIKDPLPGKSLTLIEISLQKKCFVISIFNDADTLCYTVSIWDIEKMQFIWHLNVGVILPFQVIISKDKNFLAISLYYSSINIYNINTKTLIKKITPLYLENYLIGFTDDSKNFIVYNESNPESYFSVWGTENFAFRFSQRSHNRVCKALINAEPKVYYFEKVDKKLKIQFGKKVNITKSKKYGVVAIGKFYNVFRLRDKFIISIK
ncbi:hypothetical protein SteCoe_11596 [Stentor coeruleus]|uniref:Uncharacterized protein n=1 Tax=Stentor coeruleus TaxID=5963 RepID=A0A1R2CCX0_9CILI|nr:hypothetical protein SteCoe_11596 [Stentor coeruleus]